MIVSKTRLYMSTLGCLRILFKEPDLFIKTISREPANRLMLKELVEKALASSPIQTTYEELELEVILYFLNLNVVACSPYLHR